MQIKGKKVLLMGLGILGGGVATAEWLLEQGAVLTITDMKDADALKISLEKLGKYKEKIKFVLGEHREEDFLDNEIIVINPDVPADNKYIKLAREKGKQIENELTLFFKFAPCKSIIGITGTRGKTTTTNWIGHILKSAGKDARVIGNDPNRPFLSEIKYCKEDTVAVLEMPSFQLEIFGESGMAPHIAVITNLYQDHLSRHKTMEQYALAKSNIFKNQKAEDFLVLDHKDEWTEFFEDQGPKSKVCFYQFYHFDDFYYSTFSPDDNGKHNFRNVLAAMTACKVFGLKDEEIVSGLKDLPSIEFRQQKVFENKILQIYNDTTATSPDATIAAIERFHIWRQNCPIPSLKRYFPDTDNLILISGGTDKELEFSKWAETVKKYIKPENLILLSGSATEKMKNELGWERFNEFDTLEECFKESLLKAHKKRSIILFSPASKSFEKFKNEFDRGEKFNELVKKLT